MKCGALLVGVSDYGGANNLASSLHDVDYMRAVLADDFYFPEEGLHELAGTVRFRDYEEAITAISDHRLDVLIFYFSGHGGVGERGHHLAFSDGLYQTEMMLERLSKLCRSLVVVLDCCYSGGVSIGDEAGELLGEMSGDGRILFASSGAAERSYAGKGTEPSVFTAHFVQAAKLGYSPVTGLVSLNTVEKVLRKRIETWNRSNPGHAQNIVIRSNQHGSLYFPNPSFEPYLPAIPDSFELEGCSVEAVEPIHTAAKKRYLLKVLVGESASLKEAASFTPQIIEYARKQHVYRNKRQERLKPAPVSHVFIDFYSSVDDLVGHNPKYRSIWVAEDEDKEYWYRNGEIIFGDHCSFKHSGWELQRLLRGRNRVDDTGCAMLVQELFGQVDAVGVRLFGIFDEYQNGTITEEEMRETLRVITPNVQALNDRIADIGFPGAEVEQAVNMLIGLSGDLLDALLLYSSETFLSRDPKNRKACMILVKDRYRDDYRRFIDTFHNLRPFL